MSNPHPGSRDQSEADKSQDQPFVTKEREANIIYADARRILVQVVVLMVGVHAFWCSTIKEETSRSSKLSFNVSTTNRICSSVNSGYIGSDKNSFAHCSATGKVPGPRPRNPYAF